MWNLTHQSPYLQVIQLIPLLKNWLLRKNTASQSEDNEQDYVNTINLKTLNKNEMKSENKYNINNSWYWRWIQII